MASIIDQAIQLEVQAEDNYRQASQATSDPSARDILALLADEEARHADALRGMKSLHDSDEGVLVEAAQTWIRASVEGGSAVISSDTQLPNVLRKAMDLEQ